jgi:plastocyanin
MLRKWMVITAICLMLAVVCVAGCSTAQSPAPPTPSRPSTPPPPSPPAPMPGYGGNQPGQGKQQVSIDLSAKGMAFSQSTMSVPAGATVAINFNNQDGGVPHNFALYNNASASASIFVGETIRGPSTTVYRFTAPSNPGNYFFRCDTHPGIMTGTFVVTPGPQL